MIQRVERVVLLSAPQAFFGLAYHGLVLGAIVTLLAVTSWITAVQRIAFVYAATTPRAAHRDVAVEHSSQTTAAPDGARAAVHAPSPRP
jgi:hypothetical protein